MEMSKMVSFKWFKSNSKNQPTVITFSGGMGAQIISAAIYFSKKRAGELVYADLSYFETPEHVATAGNPGDCSHWSWQLGPFGLEYQSFETATEAVRRVAKVVVDGPEKMQWGLAALAEPEAQDVFRIADNLPDALPVSVVGGYLCVHIRRGDYVNVASHLISDDAFIEQAAKFSGLLNAVVVLSDSPISSKVKQAMSTYFNITVYLDNADAFTAHRIMRNARVFICSNSQFSLIAAMLNRSALVLIPKQWFSGEDRVIERSIQSLCSFQLMA
ncbi:alpha-1,2-fucosyltransferase [Rhodoferax fermentans]|nr:alpha-1,2-fucosyltransferase [Rhodoferax fermentans]MBK1681982.1 hypothetical protein [Rhodoferax fermentans]